ncbi:MAG: DUF309 domain-containing protein [Sulfolobaceae archaeon]
MVLYYPKNVYAPSLKEELRVMGARIVDIRVCKYTEIDTYEDSLVLIIERLGEPLSTSGNKSFKELFFETKFWEAHEVLEGKWRVEKDPIKKKYLQALILLCASLVKYCKGEVEISDKLLENALSLISELPQQLLPLLNVSLSLDS